MEAMLWAPCKRYARVLSGSLGAPASAVVFFRWPWWVGEKMSGNNWRHPNDMAVVGKTTFCMGLESQPACLKMFEAWCLDLLG